MSGMSRAIIGTWALSETANDALSVSKGLVAAATSDNIQVIALLACESFGATLPTCSESSKKVEMLCSQSHQSTIISFLKAHIGFLRGDSGWQLAQSDPGCRFLALVACLLTVDRWRAAELLRTLITATAEDRRLIPTSAQIKQLLSAVNYRLACSGFADNVTGCQKLLVALTEDGSIPLNVPSSDTLHKLIKALSDLGRLGEAHTLHIETDVGEGAWMIAFIKWRLGVPPTTSFSIPGRQSLVQDNARVFLRLHRSEEGNTKDTTIILKDCVGAINELWENLPPGTGDFRGMVRLSSLAFHLMKGFGPEESSFRRAGYEAILFGCRPALYHFRCGKPRNEAGLPGMSISKGAIFPDEDVVAAVLANFLGHPPEDTLKPLPDQALVEDLPSMVTVRTQLKATCPCINCLNALAKPKQRCKFELFLRSISHCISIIFLASLLTPAPHDDVFFHFSKSIVKDLDHLNHFASAIYSCLRGTGEPSCSLDFILRELLKITGHLDEQRVRAHPWIMSVNHGQTVYPQILEDMTLRKTGLLKMVCVPGLIIYKGEKYNLVENHELNIASYDPVPGLDSGKSVDTDRSYDLSAALAEHPSQGPCDMYKDCKPTWQVSIGEEKLLVSLAVPTFPDFPEQNPIWAIATASKSFFVTCAHDRNTALAKPNPWLFSTSPVKPTIPQGSETQRMGLVCTDRNEPMRFYSLCAEDPCIVRDDACLECCIHACQMLGLKGIVC